MTILDVRNKYITEYKTLLNKKFMTIKHCAGRWGEEQMRAYSAQLPALCIALLGAKEIVQVSDVYMEASVDLALYVFCSESDSESAENIAAGLVQSVLEMVYIIAHADFVNIPIIQDAQNLYSKNLNDINVVLWGIRVEQRAWIDMQSIPSIDKIKNTSIVGG